MSNDSNGSFTNTPHTPSNQFFLSQSSRASSPEESFEAASTKVATSQSAVNRAVFSAVADHVRKIKRSRPKASHRSHFKHRFLVESAWRKGGLMTARHITPDQGVVTSLHLTKKYIVVALDNAKIHVFNVKGDHQRTLQGHVMGVWAMVPWGDILVSGGCDRDVRVWNMATGYVQSLPIVKKHTDF